MAKKKASVRKSFTPEVKAEALRLLGKGYTRKQVAAQIGCSTAALQLWKVEANSGKLKVAAKATVKDEVAEPTVKPVKRAKKTKRRRRKGVARTTVVSVAEKPLIAFDEFAQDYWREYPEATDIMRLPPDLMPKAVQYVNNVLRYAYDQFCGR